MKRRTFLKLTGQSVAVAVTVPVAITLPEAKQKSKQPFERIKGIEYRVDSFNYDTQKGIAGQLKYKDVVLRHAVSVNAREFSGYPDNELIKFARPFIEPAIRSMLLKRGILV